MRRIAVISVLVLCAFAARGQHYLGVRGGFASGSVRLFPPTETVSLNNLFSAGVAWKFYVPGEWYNGLEADLEYLQKGYRQPIAKDSDTMYVRQINTLNLPFMWQTHFELFKKRLRIFTNLGVTFSYVIDSEDYMRSNARGVYDKAEYEMKLVRDNRWAYGLVGGGGLGFITGRMEYLCEVRYYFGYSDVLKNRNKYRANPLRSPLDNLTVSFGAFYRLGGKSAKPAAEGGKLSRSEQRRVDESLEAQKNAEIKEEVKKAEETGKEVIIAVPGAIPPAEPQKIE